MRHTCGVRNSGGTETTAYGVDHAITTHGITDQSGRVRIDHTVERAARVVGIEPGYFIEHKQLVQRPVQKRTGNRCLVAVGAVGMVDRHHHITLARQVLAQMAEQEAVARITVRNDKQRVWASRRVGRGVAHRHAIQRDLGLAVACDGAVLAHMGLVGYRLGGVPHLSSQRTVIDRNRLPGFRLHDVELPGVDELQRLDADVELAVWR